MPDRNFSPPTSLLARQAGLNFVLLYLINKYVASDEAEGSAVGTK